MPDRTPPRRSGRAVYRNRQIVYAASPDHTCVHCHRLTWLDDPSEIGTTATQGQRAVAGHVIPHAQGGPDIPENMALECARCSAAHRQERRIAAQQRAHATISPAPLPTPAPGRSGTHSDAQPAGEASFLGAGGDGRGAPSGVSLSRPVGPAEWPESDPDEWRTVPWMAALAAEYDRDDTAVWPRFMSGPHPDAVGSYGVEFAVFARDRSGSELRWFQRLAATRLLEYRADGSLCWPEAVLTLARQLGKTHLLREFLYHRLSMAVRIGERQSGLMVSKSMSGSTDVNRPFVKWARARRSQGWSAWLSAGRVGVEDPDGNEWLIVALKDAPSRTCGLVIADEAWFLASGAFNNDLVPILRSARWPQLVLTSTAHPDATSTLPARRIRAMSSVGRVLLIEWSTPERFAPGDPEGHRWALPWCTPEKLAELADLYEAAVTAVRMRGEPDPMEAFCCQYLNRWPVVSADEFLKGDPLVGAEDWPAGDGDLESPPVFAVQDRSGSALSVAYAHATGEGVLVVHGRVFDDRSAGYAWVETWAQRLPELRILVGVDLVEDVEVVELGELAAVEKRGAQDTRAALAVLRHLARRRSLRSFASPALDAQVLGLRVVTGQLGLRVVDHAASGWDLAQAASWAVAAVAQQREPATPGVW
jgi:hypothetical protein